MKYRKEKFKMIDYPGWSKDYYYISDYLKEKLIGCRVIDVKGGFNNEYRGEIYFDNGMILSWHEDSEGANISIKE
jgi:hypothetical protein